MTLQRMLAEENIATGAVLDLNSVAAIKRCAARGVGICLLPRVAVDREIACGDLVLLPWEGEALETGVLMIRHKDKWLSPPLTAFMEIAREVFTKR